MNRIGRWALIAAGLGAPLAQASSPEQPLRAELRLLGAGAEGRAAVELKVAVAQGKDGGQYTVTVTRPGARPAPGAVAEPVTLASGAAVTAAQALLVEDALEVGDALVVRARYEVEVRRADGRYRGVLVVDQAFLRGRDGELKAIDFAEEMRQAAGKPPVLLTADQMAAGGNSPRRGN
jgi:hypothetical protein